MNTHRWCSMLLRYQRHAIDGRCHGASHRTRIDEGVECISLVRVEDVMGCVGEGNEVDAGLTAGSFHLVGEDRAVP